MCAFTSLAAVQLDFCSVLRSFDTLEPSACLGITIDILNGAFDVPFRYVVSGVFVVFV